MSVYMLVERNCGDQKTKAKGITFSTNLNMLSFMLRKAVFTSSHIWRTMMGNDPVTATVFDDVEGFVKADAPKYLLRNFVELLDPEKNAFEVSHVENHYQIYKLTWRGFKPIPREEVEWRKKAAENASRRFVTFCSMDEETHRAAKNLVWTEN